MSLFQHFVPVTNAGMCFHKEVAVSPNNNIVNIYEKKGKDWTKIHELTEHSGRITGIPTVSQPVSSGICWRTVNII